MLLFYLSVSGARSHRPAAGRGQPLLGRGRKRMGLRPAASKRPARRKRTERRPHRRACLPCSPTASVIPQARREMIAHEGGGTSHRGSASACAFPGIMAALRLLYHKLEERSGIMAHPGPVAVQPRGGKRRGAAHPCIVTALRLLYHKHAQRGPWDNSASGRERPLGVRICLRIPV